MSEQQIPKPVENVVSETLQTEATQSKGKKRANARTKAEEAAYVPVYEAPDRASSEKRPNAFNSIAWIVEGATGLAEEVRRSDLGLSEEFWIHLYAMQREGLLAARAAVDSLLSRTERASNEMQEQVKRQARRGEVAIE